MTARPNARGKLDELRIALVAIAAIVATLTQVFDALS